jgi:hypothetical protein
VDGTGPRPPNMPRVLKEWRVGCEPSIGRRARHQPAGGAQAAGSRRDGRARRSMTRPMATSVTPSAAERASPPSSRCILVPTPARSARDAAVTRVSTHVTSHPTAASAPSSADSATQTASRVGANNVTDGATTASTTQPTRIITAAAGHARRSALPYRPRVQVAPVTVPPLPLPEPSATEAPAPSSNAYAATSPAARRDAARGPATAFARPRTAPPLAPTSPCRPGSRHR